MPNFTYSLSVSGGGGTISQSMSRTADSAGNSEISLSAGKGGELTTRNSNSQGTATLNSGHGITTGAKVDVHWDGGVRYNMTVGTVSGTSVPLSSSGAGENLPALNTRITVTLRTQFAVAIDGDYLSILALKAKYANINALLGCHVDFQDASSNVIAASDLDVNQPRVWDITGGDTNSFTGAPITKAFASNGDSSYDATLQLLFLQDSTT